MQAMKTTWIRRLLKPNNKWSTILEEQFPEIKHFTKYGTDFLQKNLYKMKNKFWKDVFIAWTNLCKK